MDELNWTACNFRYYSRNILLYWVWKQFILINQWANSIFLRGGIIVFMNEEIGTEIQEKKGEISSENDWKILRASYY